LIGTRPRTDLLSASEQVLFPVAKLAHGKRGPAMGGCKWLISG
jgi:hypothetical protein